ncbi:MAG: hypothetical protein DMF49_01370 [Acidobacteria bacterium]|nr:MAG: hypothetical protein DMF49_01370 [Acidobacteriota bacterium]
MSLIKKLLGKRPVDYGSASRNDRCPCGSGKKFKSCCWDKVQAKKREQVYSKLFRNPKG